MCKCTWLCMIVTDCVVAHLQYLQRLAPLGMCHWIASNLLRLSGCDNIQYNNNAIKIVLIKSSPILPQVLLIGIPCHASTSERMQRRQKTNHSASCYQCFISRRDAWSMVNTHLHSSKPIPTEWWIYAHLHGCMHKMWVYVNRKWLYASNSHLETITHSSYSALPSPRLLVCSYIPGPPLGICAVDMCWILTWR
jgi:hypothetical protein